MRFSVSESDVASGRHRNLAMRGVPETFIKNSKARLTDMRHSVINYLSPVGLFDLVGIKRILRLVNWEDYAGKSTPRPMLVKSVISGREIVSSLLQLNFGRQPTARLSSTPTTNHLSTNLKH